MAQAAQDLKALLGAAKYLEQKQGERQSNALPLGIEALDSVLPDGGLPRGQVTEIAVHSPAQATSMGLWACRAAQQEAKLRGCTAWSAFVDPSQSLFAPALLAAGIESSQLLVVQPTPEAVDRVAVKLAEAQIFSVVVIDLVYAAWLNADPLAADSTPALGRWEKVVRRLSVAIQGTATQVVLLTDLEARRGLPLPVALRLELQRPSRERLRVNVAKDKYGRTVRPVSFESHVFNANAVLDLRQQHELENEPSNDVFGHVGQKGQGADVKKCSLRPVNGTSNLSVG